MVTGRGRDDRLWASGSTAKTLWRSVRPLIRWTCGFGLRGLLSGLGLVRVTFMSHRRRLTSMAATVRACVKFSPHEPHQETGCCLSHRDGVTRCQPVFAHMFAPFPPLQCLCIRPALAQFETPIDGLPENNGPKQVVVPKVVALAVFKINFPFLHSV